MAEDQLENAEEDGTVLSARAVALPLIDAHAHVYRDGMPMPPSAWHLPEAEATVEDYLATLDAAGVHFAVLSAASIFGDYNDYAVEAARRHRRLRTTVIVPPEIDPYTLQQMDRDGVVGVRLQFRSDDTPPDISSFAYQKLFRRVADLGWHVQLHDRGDRLPAHLDALRDAGPQVVVDHFGRPDPKAGENSEGFQAVLRAVARGRTWVKVSGGFRIGPPSLAKRLSNVLLSEAGTERLLWGSDWPFAAHETEMTYDAALAQYAENIPTARLRREIDRTALGLYFS